MSFILMLTTSSKFSFIKSNYLFLKTVQFRRFALDNLFNIVPVEVLSWVLTFFSPYYATWIEFDTE